MAAFNVTLDDSSPLITYSPSNAWTDTPANDTTASLYFDSSLHTTSTKGATASFAFNGTGVWLYGGLRSNYGSYQLSVDGSKVASGSAKSTTTQLKRILGGTSGLRMGEHTVSLTNEGGGPVDIDSLVFETKAGTAGGKVLKTIIDDASTNVKYGPQSNSWSTTNGTSYYDKTLHYSATNGAYASLSFSGNAVAIYGTVDPTHANYTVTLDGVKSQPVKASNVRTFHTQTLLYFAQGLESKQHTITLTGNMGTNSSQYFDLDSFTVYGAAPNATSSSSSSGAPSSTASTNPTNNNNASNNGTISANTSNGSTLSQGSLIGIVVGSIAALLLLLLGLFFYMRRRRAQAKIGPRSAKPSTPSPGIPIQNPPDLEAAYDYALREKELSPEDLRPSIDIIGRPSADYYAPKTVTARLVAFPVRPSYDSDRTLRNERQPQPQPPPRNASRPDQVPTLVVHNPPPESSHVRTPSDASTVVNDEVELGLSEIILSPSKSQRRPPPSPRSPRPRPSREELRATQGSVLSYYYHDP
ncbi:hypothetical protein EVJ58_g5079 [Rhodofomes roseus]|uniref:Transmembrane protein n=1 Tax=Rhodofomes roseus TaxID=34475 RepID=A0A4Y9YED7_9APHY|nr:hypothetical protein EVJ58_g5079 [Rhodofomes roseus]